MRATSAPSKEQDYYVHKYATKNKKKHRRQFHANSPLHSLYPGNITNTSLHKKKNATLLVNFRPHYFEHYV